MSQLRRSIPSDNLTILYDHHWRLEKAVANIEHAYGHLMAHFTALDPCVIGCHIIDFHSRMACDFAFGRGESAYIPTSIKNLKKRATFVDYCFIKGQLNDAESSLRCADAEIQSVEQYLLQLEKAIDVHVMAETWMRAKGLLKVRDRAVDSSHLIIPRAHSIVQPDRDGRKARFEHLRRVTLPRLQRAQRTTS